MIDHSEIEEATKRLTPEWLAGFFDGEGCISVGSRNQVMPNVRVQIVQADAKLLSLVAMLFPKTEGPRVKVSLSGKPCYFIRWSGRNAVKFLEMVMPHVIVKKKQVEAALQIARYVSKREGHGGDRSFPEDERKHRWELAAIIDSANAEVRNRKDLVQ